MTVQTGKSKLKTAITFIALLAGASIAAAVAVKLSSLIHNSGIPYSFQVSLVIIIMIFSLIVLKAAEWISRFDGKSPDATGEPLEGKSIFNFDDTMAHGIMTPRTDVFSIDIDDKPEEYIDELMELRYSRIPVYENDSDNIIGILNIKDFLIKAREAGFDHVDLRGILRKPYFVPETKKIDDLFFDLQSSKEHIAVLIDEYGGFSGIVTMEDIIEEVMGEIIDEYDEEEPEFEKIDDNTYMVSGFMNLSDLNEELGVNLESENIETIGGFLIDILGEIPEESEREKRIIEYGNMVFEIESVKERRIDKVKVKINKGGENDD